MSASLKAAADDSTTALANVCLAFVNLPNIDSSKVHALAELLGYTEASAFEADLSPVLASLLDGDDDQQDTHYNPDQEETDPLDTFLLAFYILVPDTTEETLAQLSSLLDLTPTEVALRTLTVIKNLSDDDDADDEGESFLENADDGGVIQIL